MLIKLILITKALGLGFEGILAFFPEPLVWIVNGVDNHA